MNLFKKKNKELNIINFGEGYWGRDIVYEENITKTICKMHGWYSNLFGNMNNQLKIGSLVIKKTNQGFWYGRVKKIEWCNDPKDMFFATIKSITNDKMLSKLEIEYLETNNLVNLESFED